MRSVERIVGCSINTVTKLLCDVGAACAACHDANVRNLNTKQVQCDEIWSFCYALAKNVNNAIAAPKGLVTRGLGWRLIADSQLILSYLVGSRDAEYANEFMQDIANRLSNTVQLTTDGHHAYLKAVEKAVDWRVDFAMLLKQYGNAQKAQRGAIAPSYAPEQRKSRYRNA